MYNITYYITYCIVEILRTILRVIEKLNLIVFAFYLADVGSVLTNSDDN